MAFYDTPVSINRFSACFMMRKSRKISLPSRSFLLLSLMALRPAEKCFASCERAEIEIAVILQTVSRTAGPFGERASRVNPNFHLKSFTITSPEPFVSRPCCSHLRPALIMTSYLSRLNPSKSDQLHKTDGERRRHINTTQIILIKIL